MDVETCTKEVWRGSEWRGSYKPCGKKVKEDGLCGLHLYHRDKKKQRAAEIMARQTRGEELQHEAARLTSALGGNVFAHYRDGRFTGSFVVSGDLLRKLANPKPYWEKQSHNRSEP